MYGRAGLLDALPNVYLLLQRGVLLLELQVLPDASLGLNLVHDVRFTHAHGSWRRAKVKSPPWRLLLATAFLVPEGHQRDASERRTALQLLQLCVERAVVLVRGADYKIVYD